VGAKWTGDNGATWDDLKSSIISIMDFNMVGIPMIGAEICGFNYNTTEELCARWIEVGAFYPFSRDHNRIDMIPQELYRWESVATAGRNALNMRYRLLPYLYTLFYLAHKEGKPVIRPLWMTFPTDREAHQIQTQFMWGDAILISPVLEPNSTQVHAYFPKGI
jgi:alpha-glucosidase (family GH31 glycosyl hydrolase)